MKTDDERNGFLGQHGARYSHFGFKSKCDRKTSLTWNGHTHTYIAPRMDLTLMMTLSEERVCVCAKMNLFQFIRCRCRFNVCVPPYTRKSLSQMSRIYSKIFRYFVSKIHITHTHTRSLAHILFTKHKHASAFAQRTHTHTMLGSHKISSVSKIPMPCSAGCFAKNILRISFLFLFSLYCRSHSKCTCVCVSVSVWKSSKLLYASSSMSFFMVMCVRACVCLWLCVF